MMKTTWKPNVEVLEDRLAPSGFRDAPVGGPLLDGPPVIAGKDEKAAAKIQFVPGNGVAQAGPLDGSYIDYLLMDGSGETGRVYTTPPADTPTEGTTPETTTETAPTTPTNTTPTTETTAPAPSSASAEAISAYFRGLSSRYQ